VSESAPTPNPAPARQRWYLRPAIALPAIVAFIIVLAVLTPEITNARRGDSRLTSLSAGPQGAKLLYELASRLGWQVERHTDRGVPKLGAHGTLALLDPVENLTAAETHQLLEQVRNGAGLLYVVDVKSPLADSLHLGRGVGLGGTYQETAAGSAEAPGLTPASDSTRTAADSATDDESADEECPGDGFGGGVPLWPDGQIHLYRLEWRRPRPSGVVTFAEVHQESVGGKAARVDPAAVGFPLGAGRLVVLSDPDLLRNDVLRACTWGADVAVVRMLEYLHGRGATRPRLVFDEYHQGYGTHPGTMRAIVLYFSRTASGHALGQVLLAGLVLLLAVGPRALPPRDVERVERRSPLEHVGALASAYEQVGATRTAAGRLLRGIRRRVERATRAYGARGPELSDEAFLAAALRADPALAPDVALIQRALGTTLLRRDFEAFGGALRRLETSLLTLRR
jgi:hypothetical protein